MTRHTLRKYFSGDHLVICDRCGKKRYRSDCRKEWQGWLVCADSCWEPRHPQDLTPPYRLDRQWVDDNRPRPIDITTYADSYVAVDFTTFAEVDADSRLAVSATQVDGDVYENSRARLTYDFGVDYFKDFKIRFAAQGQCLGIGTDSAAMLMIVGMAPSFGEQYFAGSLEGVGVWVEIGSTRFSPRLVEFTGDGNYHWIGSAMDQTYNTDMYLHVERSGGELSMSWYSDSGFTTLVQEESGSLYKESWYRFLVAPTLIYTGGSDSDATFELKDLAIAETQITPITH